MEPREVDAFSFVAGERTTFGVIDRAGLEPGTSVAGPMIVLEDTATTYVDVGFDVMVDPSGALVLSRES
jgi:N-methylhydantoinase A